MDYRRFPRNRQQKGAVDTHPWGREPQQCFAAYFQLQFPAELEKTMTGGKKMLKKITGSNKFSHNGLKNKMLPKQV